MNKDLKAELKQLKKKYLEMERANYEGKECLLSVINTFGTIVAMHEEMTEELQIIKKMVNTDTELPLDLIEKEIGKLKDKIISKESEALPDKGIAEQINDLKGRLQESCKMIKRIMVALLEDFYPVTDELKAKADVINIECHKEVKQAELTKATGDFLSFIEGLKARISEDFKYINKTFLTLLEHVKELEKMLTSEFGGEERLKEIDYFEMKVSHEVGSIVNSFNIYTTISEIKSTVVNKIENIKRLVSLRKKEEVKKTRSAQKNIEKLKKKIQETEIGVRELSRKAEKFQEAAMNDGLTGLHNRKAFDIKVKDALKMFEEKGETYSIILFDVDKFKDINDTFGHVAGDKVLKKVAQCLKETFRESDFIARYGGDEFVVIIERLTREMASERIMNFGKNLKKRRFVSYKKGDINISASAGIAMVMEGDTPESFIERADKSMYASKQKKQ